MRLSETLRRGIIESFTGGIINNFKIRKRRNVLFFEEILAEYIHECEKAGYENDMMALGINYGYLGSKCLIPDILKRYNYAGFLNIIAKNVWITLGLMESFNAERSGNKIVVKTKEEFITRMIGKNRFIAGMSIGILSGFYSKKIELITSTQEKGESRYVVKITDVKIDDEKSKDKEQYNSLNQLPEMTGLTLKHLLKQKIFLLKENRIYFKGQSIIILENTLFHLIGNKNIALKNVPSISLKVFRKICGDKTDLKFIKNIVQVTGWGGVKIADKGNEIVIELLNPPYGLQSEKDNWKFLALIILGYLWLKDNGFKIVAIKNSLKKVTFIYLRERTTQDTAIVGR